MLSAGITLVGGVVTIDGTNGQDTALVTYTSPDHSVIAATLNGSTVDFASASVSSILFRGFGGTNSFSNATDLNSVAIGGNGFNFFGGGSADDTFVGGNGVNVFFGGGDDDILVGGTGLNVFFCDNGTESVLEAPGGTYVLVENGSGSFSTI